MIVSDRFRAAVKLSSLRCYQIAQLAGLNPSTLSQIVNRIIEVRPNDYRVISVARVLGLDPEECFEQPATSGAKGNSR